MKDKDAHLMMEAKRNFELAEGMYQVQPNQLEREPAGTREDPGQVAGMIVQTLKRIYDEFRTLPNQPTGAAYAVLQKYMADPMRGTEHATKDSEEDHANALQGMFTTTDQGLQFKN